MLVGRDGDLARLRAALDADGLVALRGPFGIGKSAVVGALATQYDPTLIGQALHALVARPYQPFLHALNRPPRALEPPSMVGLLAPVLRDVGLLVLEDLQWADAGTLEVLVGVRNACRMLVTVQDGAEGSGRVLRLVRSLGGAELRLGPLDPEALDDLVGRLRPDLLRGERARVVASAAGNPLIASVLARTEGRGDALRGDGRAIVAAFVSQQPPEARYSLALMSQSASPLPAKGLGGVAALTDAGLVELDGEGRVRLRHGMFGQSAYEGLSEPDRTRLFDDLASSDVGSAPVRAEFLLRAGRVRRAFDLAREAATGPLPRSEQAHASRVVVHASRALRSSGHPEAPDDGAHHELVVAAARSSNDRLEHDRAAEVLDILGADAATSGDAAVEMLRAALGRGDRSYASRVLAATASQLGGFDEPHRRTASTLHALLRSWSGEVTLSEVARGQLELARSGTERSHAALLVGLASYQEDVGNIDAWFEVARVEAAAAGARFSEFEAARNLVLVQLAVGRKAEARELCRQCLADAQEAGEIGWAGEFRCLELLGTTYENADHDVLLSELSLLRSAPVRLETRAFVTAGLAALLADLGAARRSEQVLEPWLVPDALEGFDPMVQGVISWSAVQRAWILGDLSQAIRAARWATERLPHGFPGLAGAQVVWRWSEYESELPITAPTPAGGFLECARLEAVGIDRLVAGDHAGAADQFLTAEESWRPVLWRSALRCRWGAGHAWALAGDAERALAILRPLDADLDRHGSPALRPRLHATLGLVGARPVEGDRRSGASDLLSRREHEVLELVAEGLTSAEVARRLGITLATVNTHVAAAMRKLGVPTRAAAAARIRVHR